METTITPAAPRNAYRLSAAQRRVWVLNRAEQESRADNTVFGLILEGELDYDVFNQTIAGLVERHESLRTVFGVEADEPRQYPLDPGSLDLSACVAGQADGLSHHDIARIVQREEGVAFDLGRFPLFRYRLIRAGDRQHICLFTLHRVIADDASRTVLRDDFCRLYQAARSGKPAAMTRPAVQVKDYAEWQGQPEYWQRLAGQEDYWLRTLEGGLPSLRLPAGAESRSSVQPGPGDAVTCTFSPELTGRLEAVARDHGVSLDVLLLALYAVCLSKRCNQAEVAIGTPVAGRRLPELQPLIGLFENTVVLRLAPLPDLSFASFLGHVAQTAAEAFAHQEYPYEALLGKLRATGSPRPAPVVRAMYEMVRKHDARVDLGGLTVADYPVRSAVARYDLSLEVSRAGDNLELEFRYATGAVGRETVETFVAGFNQVASAVASTPDERIARISILSDGEQARLLAGIPGGVARSETATLRSLFEREARCNAGKTAVVYEANALTYGELNERANGLAYYLRDKYRVGPGCRVALTGPVSQHTVVGLLGVLKAGGAYVLVDPGLPAEKAGYILEDCQPSVLLFTGADAPAVGRSHESVCLDRWVNRSPVNPPDPAAPDDLGCLAYDPYPAGAPPRGTMRTHANLAHLVTTMNENLPLAGEAGLLALADPVADPAGLRLLWPLCRGIEVVIHPPGISTGSLDRYVLREDVSMDFSLFFFANYNVDAADKYKLLVDAVTYADREDFAAVWTPERHFYEFGGLFPNPAVTSAALAMITRKIAIRSGSIVSPLHDVIRIAEEWAVVDNLSGGRAGLSFAPGWNINDFVLGRDNYEARHRIMHEQMETVKRLWKGESIKRENAQGKEIEVRTYPAPVRGELPIWITAAGNEQTFVTAGEKGAHLLTHLLGQDTLDLARKIKLYRQARSRNGLDPTQGKVAVMLHTYVGDDITQVEKVIEKPFTEYLKSAIGLSRILYEEAGLKAEDIPEADKEIMLKHSFRRYYQTSALIGTPSSCSEMIKKLKGMGVDEIACLVDFGMDHDAVMVGLTKLKELKELFGDHSRGVHRPVTVLPVSPGEAARIAAAPGSVAFLRSLRVVLLQGAGAIPDSLLNRLQNATEASLYRTYGATEATGVDRVSLPAGKCRMGNPPAYVLNGELQLLPAGAEGDLYLGGDGVSPGYWQKPEATGQRFVPNPYRAGERLFRTGDTGKWLPGGEVLITGCGPVAEPGAEASAAEGHPAPATETEELLLGQWSRLLGTDRAHLDGNSNFFALGGDSIRGVRLAEALRETFGVTVGLEEVYRHPTLRGLARELERRGVESLPLIPPAGDRAEHPLTFVQEQLYNDQRARPDDCTGHVLAACRIGGDYDPARLNWSFGQLPDRHDALRTGFGEGGKALRQRVHEGVRAELPGPDRRVYQTMAEAMAGFVQPFDLSVPPLLRGKVVRHQTLGDVLLLHAHGLVCDAGSLILLLDDLRRIYAGTPLPPPARRYADYACWQRSPRPHPDKQAAFWAEQLLGAPGSVDLPVVRSREPADTYPVDRTGMELGDGPTGQLAQLSAQAGTPTHLILLSVYYILMAKITGQADLLIGVRATGRRHRAMMNVVGAFARVLPLRVVVADEACWRDFLASVRTTWQQAIEHQEFEYEKLFAARNSGTTKSTELYFSYTEYAGGEAVPGGLDLVPLPGECRSTRSEYDFGMEAYGQAGKLGVDFVYCRDLYDPEAIELFKEYWRNILLTVLDNPQIAIRDIELESSLKAV